MRKLLSQPILIFLFAFLISLPVILPYFHPGYFPTHDGEWAVVRLSDMFRSLRDHQFPVRYSGYLNFGYGYPLFNFVYPFPYYLGMVFHVFKLGFIDTIKLLFASSVVISALGMYFASREIWKNTAAGIISALLYVYLPYRIVDLYARGSIGESLAFMLFPIILFFVAKSLDNLQAKRYLILAAISYAFLIMTHNIMAVLFSPVLIIFMLIKMRFTKKSAYKNLLIFFLLSYGLAAFFWLPALLEKGNILLSVVPIADRNIYFVKLSQLIIPRWGYGMPDHMDGFSYQIGLSHIVVLLMSTFLLVFSIKKKISKNFHFLYAFCLVIASFVSVLMMFSFTATIWKATPLLKEINYPWTLLAPLGFMLSLLAGFLWMHNKYLKYILVVVTFIAIALTLPHAKPEYYIERDDNFYLTNDATTTSSQELTPLWVKEKPLQRAEKKVEIVEGKGDIHNIFVNSKKITFDLDVQSKSVIRINTTYYPGWNVAVDGIVAPITYNNKYGVMDVVVSPGTHQVKATFGETPLRMFSNYISLVSLFVLVFLYRQSKIKS